MNSEFQSFSPRNEELKKNIAYFYFDKSENHLFEKKYSFFPHTHTTLTFYKKASITENDGLYNINHSCDENMLMLLTRQQSIKTVLQKGLLDKIGIVFYATGLNHFLKEPYCSLAKQEVQIFSPVNEREWRETVTQCFSASNNAQRQEIMESFLCRLFKPKNFHTLYKVIEILSDVSNTQTIKNIAQSVYISPRKLNRDFKKELAITPEMFRVISRFRHIVNEKAVLGGSKRFTELAHESGYFDQATLTKTFRRFTTLSPKDFFRKCYPIGQNGTVWHFHDTKNVV